MQEHVFKLPGMIWKRREKRWHSWAETGYRIQMWRRPEEVDWEREGKGGSLVRAAVGGKAEVGRTRDQCVSTHVALRWSDSGADSFHNP